MERKKILIVDDDEMLCEIFQKLFEDNGYYCTFAPDIKKARELINANVFDLILCDIHLPDGSGLDFIRPVREEHPETAVIIITGTNDLQKAKIALEMGINRYIIKPISLKQLLIIVENTLRKQEVDNAQQSYHTELENLVREKTSELQDTVEHLTESKEELIRSKKALQSKHFFLQTLLNAIPNPIFCRDRNGIFVKCNSAFESVIGLTKEEIVGKTVFDIDAEDLTKYLHESDIEMIREPGKRFFEISIPLADGKIHDFLICEGTFSNENEDIVGLVSSAINITELKTAQEKLIESEARFRNLIEGSIQGIIIYKNFKAVFVNQTFGDIYGYTIKEIEEMENVFAFVAHEEHSRVTGYIDRILRGKDNFLQIEIEGVRKDGTKIWLDNIICLVDWGGESAIQVTVSDITRRRKYEDALMASEEKFRAISDSAGDAIAMTDLDGFFTYWNQSAERISHYSKDEVLGKNYNDFLIPERYRAELEQLFKCLNNDKKLRPKNKWIEIAAIRKGGEEYPIEMSLTTVNIMGTLNTVAIVREITDRKKAEALLKLAHAELKMQMNGISSILIGISDSNIITEWNKVAENSTGISAKVVLGKPIGECEIAWEKNKVLKGIATCSKKRQSVVIEDVRYTRADGKERFLRITLSSLKVIEGIPHAILLLGDDVTKRKDLEFQLSQARKLESIGQLAAGIAHEINTPTQYIGDNTRFLQEASSDLGSVFGQYDRLLQAVKKGTPTDKIVRDLEEIIEEVDVAYLREEIPKAIEQALDGVDRVSKIVHSMKEFSHPGANEKTAVDLNKALESTITVARNEWKYVADMETDFDNSLPLVHCVPGEINQVFLNMITNAAHAIGEVVKNGDNGKGKIIISTRGNGDSAEICIKDTGSGIPVALRHRIFDPFFTTKKVGKGTGQGLSISHSVVTEKHGGSINFETGEGQGTTFTIQLPIGEQGTNGANI